MRHCYPAVVVYNTCGHISAGVSIHQSLRWLPGSDKAPSMCTSDQHCKLANAGDGQTDTERQLPQIMHVIHTAYWQESQSNAERQMREWVKMENWRQELSIRLSTCVYVFLSKTLKQIMRRASTLGVHRFSMMLHPEQFIMKAENPSSVNFMLCTHQEALNAAPKCLIIQVQTCW